MKSSDFFNEHHVVPFNDLKPHTSHQKCWCHPKEIEPDLWVHNSLDGREYILETGREKGLLH